MRYCLAVPTYWTYPGGAGQEEVIYDHPTPLDAEGTLGRFLASVAKLVNREVQVVIVAAATAPGLQAAVEERVTGLMGNLYQPPAYLLFSYSHLERLREFCRWQGGEEFLSLLSLTGYSRIRNLTLILANLFNAEVMVSLDDDEIILDPDFLNKIAADFSFLARDRQKFGVAGLYENPQGEVLAVAPTGNWVKFWPKIKWMNAAFTALLGEKPHLKMTPLALGGNMAVGASLYRWLPFDPAVARGEDIDYVINARMFQVPFFMDTDLRVRHDPPAKPHPLWLRLRQDLDRFWYTREKLLSQETLPGMTRVTPAELMPYPGNFLTEDLEIRAYQAHSVLARAYLEAGNGPDALETLRNLELVQGSWPSPGVFRTYLEVVKIWRRLQAWLSQPRVREEALRVLWG